MKSLPESISPYKQTPTFTETTVPAGLLSTHTTKDGVWAKIVVLEGELLYRILEPELEEVRLSADYHGVIEPQIRHQVEPLGKVQFYVEFHK
ncbi:MAG: tellurite resistance-related uncharacterized protein [Candidatus Promineifilaceae bacterium]|jgi:tellurite resistance-related uncharacterized protein